MRWHALAIGLTAALVFPTGAAVLASEEPEAPAVSPQDTMSPVTHVLDPPGNESFGGWKELGRMAVQAGDGTELYFGPLAALGDRLVLLTRQYPIEGGETRTTPWYSDDGVTWIESELPGRPHEVTDMVGTPDAVIAVGVSGTRGEREARVWTTTDGAEWTLAAAPPISMISRILTTDPLIVVGSGSGMWSSPDGKTWEALGKYPAGSIEAGASGFISAGGGGQDGFTPTVLWHSRDGRKWSRVRLPKVLQGGHPAFGGIQVVPVGGKWMLVPADKTPGSMFLSKGGRRWRRVPRPAGMQGDYVYWAERIGDRIQAFGNAGWGQANLWTWKMGQPTSKRERLKGLGIGRPVRWQSGYVATGEVSDGLVLWRWVEDS